MSFADVYPHYLVKAEKKGRSKAEVDEIIRWLTGYNQTQFERCLEQGTTHMDASAFLPEGVPSHWSVYWDVVNVDASVAQAQSLGGTLVDGPKDSPYGRMATVTDSCGAMFKLRTPPQ